MSKKLTKSIASIACAALMASQMFAFNASAIENNGGYYYYYNGVYYSYPVDADTASGVAGTYEAVPTSRVPAPDSPTSTTIQRRQLRTQA